MSPDVLIDVCERLGLGHSQIYTSGRRGDHISISCPLAPFRHMDPYDGNKSCSVRLDSNGPSLVRCHSGSCEFKGSLFRLLSLAIGLGEPDEGLDQLLKDVKSAESVDPEQVCERLEWAKSAQAVAHGPVIDYDVLDESILEKFVRGVPRYAVDRGMSIDSCKRWGLCYDKKNERLLFPVRRRDTSLVGMTGRDITNRYKTEDGRPKYKNYPGLDKTKYLYGENLWEQGRPMILVEGQIDAILVDQCFGDANVAGLLGSGFTPLQASRIADSIPTEVFLFPDGDAAGAQAMAKVFHALSAYPTVLCFVVDTPPGEDPASLLAGSGATFVRDLVKGSDMILSDFSWSVDPFC